MFHSIWPYVPTLLLFVILLSIHSSIIVDAQILAVIDNFDPVQLINVVVMNDNHVHMILISNQYVQDHRSNDSILIEYSLNFFDSLDFSIIRISLIHVDKNTTDDKIQSSADFNSNSTVTPRSCSSTTFELNTHYDVFPDQLNVVVIVDLTLTV
ncbi:hypothetical protein DERP_003965 [Dermatophagoides pteronyssinus]|uniref:Uncharacterized protein n=1 Tax=Dermatophagoides pteronyssinus TaxID=6956 RepID=A0ABQ8J7R4_DERPT|nr:hypothetical protein DERP_003965 [Dermatophagoides pteronyssinus]